MFHINNNEELSLSRIALSKLIKIVLKRGFSLRFKAKGKSMMPSINNGDIITISPLNNDKIRINDIVAFIEPTRKILLVHRVIKIDNDKFLIKGDNVYNHDGYIPRSNILGRVIKIGDF